MEGPSLYLAAEQLIEFKGKKIKVVSGNSKVGIKRLESKTVTDIFSWGKHLVFQFDDFAMRIHFMLFGTFEADVNGVTVTGDYKRAREPRLALTFDNGEVRMFSCSVKFLETSDAKSTYDFSIDILSKQWNLRKALDHIMACQNEQIADVLLDQEIFAGVGNIIKNEVLSIVKINPKTLVKSLSPDQIQDIIKVTHDFSWQFYKWRKKFVLTKHLKIHRRSVCPHCGTKVIREKTGKRERWAYYCPKCQTF